MPAAIDTVEDLWIEVKRIRRREMDRIRMEVWREANPKKNRAAGRAWNTANRAKRCAISMAWRKANPDKAKAWHKANPERVRARNSKRRALKRGATIGDISAIVAWDKKWKRLTRVTCHWCRRPFPPKRCHADHVIPLAKGGAHSLENLVVACASCNLSKRAKLPADWNKQLTEPVLL